MPELSDPLRFLPGVGPARAKILADNGLHSIEDLLYCRPRCLSTAPDECTDGELPRGVPVQVRARVTKVSYRPFGRRRVLDVSFADAAGQTLRARFFNAAYLRDRLPIDEWFLLEGRTDAKQNRMLNHPKFTHLSQGASDEREARSGCSVSYPAIDGLGTNGLAKMVHTCLERYGDKLTDPLGQLDDSAYRKLIHNLHEPPDEESYESSRRALAQRELIALASLLHQRRQDVTARPGHAWAWTDTVHQRALARLPFALTAGQEQALHDIRRDMQAPEPMYRLLQGDVGSGKTALALLAALAVIAEGSQAICLAPTAVLAAQHHDFFSRCLQDTRVRIELLTGGTGSAERKRILDGCHDGTIDMVIGTHAILEDAITFARPGLFIIDEQHKFGVEQRAHLLAKGDHAGSNCDMLALTATPIPRTLALTCFGDLAVSTITGKPPGRQAVTTELQSYAPQTLITAVQASLAAGGQAFVVTALRQASEKIAAQDVHAVGAILADAFPGKVGIVHGALPEADKLQLLQDFKAGVSTILVSTIVIEVGVDVGSANLMAIIDADRFGLAQLHQLRGRIGRGDLAGRCLLLCQAKANTERLEVLIDSTDGLAIAEADLAQRGPGEFLGKRQHGLPNLQHADLSQDIDLLQAAHETVRQTAGSAPERLESLRQRFLPNDANALLAGA